MTTRVIIQEETPKKLSVSKLNTKPGYYIDKDDNLVLRIYNFSGWYFVYVEDATFAPDYSDTDLFVPVNTMTITYQILY